MPENSPKVFTTAPKNGKRKSSPSPVRERCIFFIHVLKQMGYDKTIPLSDAYEIFQNEIGIMDAKSVRAYFGTRAGKSKKTMSSFKRFQNGGHSLRLIELTTDIDEKPGYFEILGLVDFEKQGKVWFMNIRRDFVVPLWSPQPREVCGKGSSGSLGLYQGKESKIEISLSSIEGKEHIDGGANEENNAVIELEYTHTTQRRREKSSLENDQISEKGEEKPF